METDNGKNLAIPGSEAANTIREVATLLGKISSSFLMVTQGKLHYRRHEKAKTLTLAWNKGRYDRPKAAPSGAVAEVCWWRDNINPSHSHENLFEKLSALSWGERKVG